MGTFTIPATVLQVGAQDFGPAAVTDADTVIIINIDRTASRGQTQGLNGQPATTTLQMETFQSDDGGVTWMPRAKNTVQGGIFTKGGNQINTDQVGTQLSPGTGRQVKATVTVTGASVVIAGTIVTS